MEKIYIYLYTHMHMYIYVYPNYFAVHLKTNTTL